MFESLMPDANRARRILEREHLRERVGESVAVQQRLPYGRFIVTTSAAPEDACRAIAGVLSARRGPAFVVDTSAHASAAGSNVYVKVRYRQPWQTVVGFLIAAAPLALIFLFVRHHLILPLGLIVVFATTATVALQLKIRRVQRLLAVSLPQKGARPAY